MYKEYMYEYIVFIHKCTNTFLHISIYLHIFNMLTILTFCSVDVTLAKLEVAEITF